MTPQLVNAVNLPAMNALNFPAAILQAAVLRSEPADRHGLWRGRRGDRPRDQPQLDDQGALFDATGRLQNWWTPEDFAHFKASSTALARQYDTYRPFPDLAINGALTNSENIADGRRAVRGL